MSMRVLRCHPTVAVPTEDRALVDVDEAFGLETVQGRKGVLGSSRRLERENDEFGVRDDQTPP